VTYPSFQQFGASFVFCVLFLALPRGHELSDVLPIASDDSHGQLHSELVSNCAPVDWVESIGALESFSKLRMSLPD